MIEDSSITTFPKCSNKIPTISTSQMIEVDRLMIEVYRIDLIQMMENAGRALALVAKKEFLDRGRKNAKVVVLAGNGGNGGGALVCARRLLGWGFEVSIYITNTSKITAIPAHQLEILRNMGASIFTIDHLDQEKNVDLIIDGIIGYSLHGHPHGVAKRMIEWANLSPSQILSLDTPSGLDLSEGKAHDPAIKASATLTLALPKAGLYMESGPSLRGKLFLADISVPLDLYAQSSLKMEVGNIFENGDIIELV